MVCYTIRVGELFRTSQGVIYKSFLSQKLRRFQLSINEQVVYKLRHKGTGLYYLPQGCKVNTDKLGAVYNKKPARVSWVGFQGVIPDGYTQRYSECDLTDWIVVEYKLSEVKEKNDSIRKPIDKNCGIIFSLSDFKDSVGAKFITDNDGFGRYSDGTSEFEDVDTDNIEDYYDFVIWYNK